MAGSVDDRWFNKAGEPTARNGVGKRWLARYRPIGGRGQKEITKSFAKKTAAKDWLDAQTSKLVTGTHIHPRNDKTTVGEWADLWLAGYGTRRESTVRQAKTHLAQITARFGDVPLGSVRPSQVRQWCSDLKAEGYEASYVYALHSRLAQLYTDAIEDGIVPRSPCSRRTSPGMGKQRPYLATTEQVWALYDAFPENLRPAVLLGALAGLRDAEVCGHRIEHIDFMRGIVHPTYQYPAEELKTEASKWAVPIGQKLALELAAHVKTLPAKAEHLILDEMGNQVGPWKIQRVMRRVRSAHVMPLPDDHAADCSGCLIPGLPEGFRFHDLRHYFASLLIADGADVKVVQRRMRHALAKTTLDTYGHLWPDADESTRAAIDKAMTARADHVRTAEGGAT